MDTSNSNGSMTGSWRYSYLDKCLENFVKTHRDKPGSCRKLSKAFPELYKKHPEAMTLISDSFGDKYTELLRKSIRELMTGATVEKSLQELDELDEIDGVSWRPSGNPEEDIRAHIALAKQAEIQNLEQQLATEDEDLQKLRDVLAQKDKAIKQKLLHVNAVTEEVTSAARVALSNHQTLLKLLEQSQSEHH